MAALSATAERELRDGASFFEFRLDYLPDPRAGLALIRKFHEVHADTTILATCRHVQAHGRFKGSIDEQLAILRQAGAAGAAFIDVEIESAEKRKPALAPLRDAATLMVSYHNFQTTPALDPILRRLRKIPAGVYKIATTARKPSDNMRVVQLIRQHEDLPLVALAMSEIGLPSRVLTSAAGAAFTYAAPGECAGTAPGQLAARTLRSLYRPDKLTRASRIYGVIADPVAHSKSPFIHNRAFQARRIDAVYLPFLVPQRHLADWMTTAERLPVAGFSVTIPHKRRIMHYLDAVEPLARRIGAVNTVWRKAGKWRGTNTDADGVLKPLCRQIRPAKATVLIAGYGGAARAAAVALNDAGARVTVTGRNLPEARALARFVKGEAITLAQAQARTFDVLIHATPVGMSPEAGRTLFPDRVPSALVLDMVYNPHETLLLKQARAQGCAVIPGAEMLLEQAAAQFELWSGESAPRDVMRTALEVNL